MWVSGDTVGKKKLGERRTLFWFSSCYKVFVAIYSLVLKESKNCIFFILVMLFFVFGIGLKNVFHMLSVEENVM